MDHVFLALQAGMADHVFLALQAGMVDHVFLALQAGIVDHVCWPDQGLIRSHHYIKLLGKERGYIYTPLYTRNI